MTIYRPETVLTVGQVRYPSEYYWANTSFSAKTVSVAADRYTVLTPNAMQIDVGGVSLTLSSQVSIDLSSASNWDDYADDGDWEIGRASCRERVCQYV